MEWAIDARATGPLLQSERLVLTVMAKYAQPDGSRVFCGRAMIAAHTDLSLRSVSRALAALLTLGLIDYGDQSYVAHHPVWARPAVYDLAVGQRATPPQKYEDYSDPDPEPDPPDPVTPASPPDARVTPCHPRHPLTHVARPPDAEGMDPLTPVSTKPNTEPTTDLLPVVPKIALWCRRCDEVHRTNQPCPDMTTDHQAGAASVRAALKPRRLDDEDKSTPPTREDPAA